MSNQEPTIIGIDLGTYKTAVVSSNGMRETFLSVVGWPKDQVARKVSGRTVLVGSDVLRHRLAMNVVRPFRKGMLKYHDPVAAGFSSEDIDRQKTAVKLLIEHAVSLVAPPQGRPIYAVLGVPSNASTETKQFLVEVAETVFDRVLVVSEPFAVAFAVDMLEETLVVDVGAGTVDICPMYGAFPDDASQVTVHTGGDFVDEEFRTRVETEFPDALLPLNHAREIKEKYGSVRGHSDKVMMNLPTLNGSQQCDISKPLQEACRSLVSPIVDGIREAIRRLDPEFRGPMLKNILLSGGGSQLRGLDWEIEEQLRDYEGVKVTRVYDSVFAGAMGAFKLATGMPSEQWIKMERIKVVEKDAPTATTATA